MCYVLSAAYRALGVECCVLRAMCYVLRVACRVLCVTCCVLRVVCCVLRVACCVLCVACRVLRAVCVACRVLILLLGVAVCDVSSGHERNTLGKLLSTASANNEHKSKFNPVTSNICTSRKFIKRKQRV